MIGAVGSMGPPLFMSPPVFALLAPGRSRHRALAALLCLCAAWLGACSADPDAPASGTTAPTRPALDLLELVPDVQRADAANLVDVDLSAAPHELPEGWSLLQSDADTTVIAFAIETFAGELTLDVEVAAGGLRLAAIRAPKDSAPLPEDAQARTAWIEQHRRAPARREVIVQPGAASPPTALLLERDRPDGPKASGRVILLVEYLAPGAAVERLVLARRARFTIQHESRVLTLPDLTRGPVVGRVGIAGDDREALVLPVGSARTITLDATDPALHGRARLAFAIGGIQPGAPAELGDLALDVTLSNANGALVEHRFGIDPIHVMRARHWMQDELKLPAELGPGPLTLRLAVSGARPGDAVAIAGLSLAGGAPPAADVQRPHIFLVSLDTLRRDRVGADGQAGSLTPNLDAFEARALVFEGATAVAPFTLPTHATVFSGRLPTEHGGVDFKTPIARDTPMIASAFAAAGWTTAAFTGGGFLAPEFGFVRGFDRYTVHDPLITIETLPPLDKAVGDAVLGMDLRTWEHRLRLESAHGLKLRAVKDWIAAHADTPQFLFLHTYAAHQYQPPKRIYLEELAGTKSALTMRPMIGELDDARFRREPPSADDVEHMRRLYDACVRHADEEFGRFLAYLDEVGLAESSYVIVFSDHGEQLFEHDQFGHSNHVWETLLGVPLAIRGPGIAAQRIPDPVSLLDLGPTLAELAGLPPLPDSLGRPLVQRKGAREWQVAGRVAHSDAGVFSEVTREQVRFDSLIMGEYKLIRRYGPGGDGQDDPWGAFIDALYHLPSDPGELNDLAASRPQDVARLAARLEAWRRIADARAAGVSADAELAAGTLEQLEQLGYL